MTADEFLVAAKDALERCHAPIVYLHKDGETGPFAVMITMPALGQLEVRGPVTEEVKEQFWMRHSHVEPGMW